MVTDANLTDNQTETVARYTLNSMSCELINLGASVWNLHAQINCIHVCCESFIHSGMPGIGKTIPLLVEKQPLLVQPYLVWCPINKAWNKQEPGAYLPPLKHKMPLLLLPVCTQTYRPGAIKCKKKFYKLPLVPKSWFQALLINYKLFLLHNFSHISNLPKTNTICALFEQFSYSLVPTKNCLPSCLINVVWLNLKSYSRDSHTLMIVWAHLTYSGSLNTLVAPRCSWESWPMYIEQTPTRHTMYVLFFPLDTWSLLESLFHPQGRPKRSRQSCSHHWQLKWWRPMYLALPVPVLKGASRKAFPSHTSEIFTCL